MTQHHTRDYVITAAAAGMFGFGLLLLFEIVRPFRDPSIDGPIAMGA